MVSFIPFQFAIDPRGREQIICLTDRCSDLRHYRISRSLLAVAQAEVYCFRVDLVFPHIFYKLWEPGRRRCRRNSVEDICLIASPERKQRCKRVSADKDSLYSPRFDFLRGRHYFAQDKFQCNSSFPKTAGAGHGDRSSFQFFTLIAFSSKHCPPDSFSM